MTDKKPISALWSQYRLSRSEDARFPAALQDAITLYHYVLDLGVPAENIIISGESAGGHLVIALLRYIADYKTLPWPRGAIAWSPWCDISHRALDGYRKSHRYKTDILNMGMLEWGIGAFPPRDRNEESERYLSPVDYPFPCKAPLYINVGTDEVLYPEIHNFAKRMQEVQGNRIRYEEMKDVPHDVLLNAYFTGLTAEAEHQAAQAGQFFEIEK
jgi:acetyl esterase/lipase